MRNGIIAGNVTSGTAILIQPQSTGPATVVIDNVHVENYSQGISAYDYTNVTVRNSVSSRNAGGGIRAISSVGGPVSVFVEHSQTSHNGGNGVLAQGATAIVRISEVTITDNGLGVNYVSGGTVCSFGNSIAGNSATLPPTPCPLS